MDIGKLIHSLEQFGKTLPAMVAGLSDIDTRWKPESGNWSVLEVVCHLADEETEDFRLRVMSTLKDPAQNWPSIDPPGWAQERRYNDQDLDEQIKRFVAEREKSIAMLKSIENPAWDSTYQHPQLGPITAGEVMAAWAAHDHLHARQISKRRFEMIQRDAGSFSTRYAGDWTA